MTAATSSIVTGTGHEASGPVLLIHGGAWDIPDDEVPAYENGLRAALEVGRRRIVEGKSATDVVTEVIVCMEDSAAFDAGRGSVLRSDRTAVLDAGIMRGEDLAFGSVAAVRRIANPILFARALQLGGEGIVRAAAGPDAERLAESMGFKLVAPDYHICQRELQRFDALSTLRDYHTSDNFIAPDAPQGTVGCVVLDASGGIAAGTSTGGTPLSPPGRVGDTPMPGCGFYATAQAGASATGWGEAIATVLLCGSLVREAGRESRTLDLLVSEQLAHMNVGVANPAGGGATGGAILVRATGAFAWGYSTPRMARGSWTPSSGFAVTVS